MRGGNRIVGLLALACVLFGVRPVPGAMSDGSPGSEPPQPELLLFEEPIVSAAAKHPQPAREAPSAVTVITREEIQRFGYRTLAEALRSVRGFYGSSDRNYDYIGVRGFLRPSDYNDRILLLVDGHTYNDDMYQTALLGNEFGIDLEAVERIEVIRGPGSALYGGNALFAVVNVVTATGEARPGTHLLVETGSLGRKRGQMSVGHVFENGVDVFASGSVLDLDGNGRLYYPEYDTPQTNHGVANDAEADRALNFYLKAHYHDLVLQGGTNSRDKHVPTGFFDTTFNDPGTKTTDQRSFADLQYSRELVPDLTVTARTFYDRYRYHGTYIYGAGTDRVKNEDLAVSDWFGGEVRAQWQPVPANVGILGAEYTYHPGAMQKNFDLPSGELLFEDNQSFTTWGVFVQDEFTLRPDLTLVGGARYDRYYNRVDHFSPRAAAIWSPLPDTRMKLLYGQAFRAPNLFEQFYNDGVFNLKNPNLQEERIETYETEVEQGLGRWAQGVVALYHYEITDLIDQVPVAGSSTGIKYQNIGSARATGAEFEVRVQLPRGWSGRAGYSVQEADAAGGRQLSNSPKHLGNLALLFPLLCGVQGGAELRIMSPRRTIHDRQLDTVTTANVNLTYATPIPRLGVSVGLYNIFDQTFADPVGAEFRQDSLPQDGFTFRTQLFYGF